jgi:hypothetical protein
MTNWLRRIKGGVGIGLTWAVAWVPIGAITALGLSVVGDVVGGLLPFVVTSALLFAALGFIGGNLFSAVLQLRGVRRRFDELTVPSFALWGGVAGLLVPGIAEILGRLAGIAIFGGPGLQVGDVVVACVASLLSAGSAAGSLAIARKADESPGSDPLPQGHLV